jgi:hypothetical protein
MNVIRAHRKELRICLLVSSPMIQSIAVLEEVKSSTQRVTVVGDTLSAARDIVTAVRMMCIVTLRAGVRTKYVIVWLGGLIVFSRLIAGALAGVAASFAAVPLWRGALTVGRGRMRFVPL